MAKSPPILPIEDATAAGKTSFGLPWFRAGLLGSVLMSRCLLHDTIRRSAEQNAVIFNFKIFIRLIIFVD
jgi:hypothetical protein